MNLNHKTYIYNTHNILDSFENGFYLLYLICFKVLVGNKKISNKMKSHLESTTHEQFLPEIVYA